MFTVAELKKFDSIVVIRFRLLAAIERVSVQPQMDRMEDKHLQARLVRFKGRERETLMSSLIGKLYVQVILKEDGDLRETIDHRVWPQTTHGITGVTTFVLQAGSPEVGVKAR